MIETNTDFDLVTDFGNLYQAYLKSKSGKGFRKSSQKFQLAALDGVLRIQNMLETKNYEISPYNEFVIYEPKERVIKAGSFVDKIVQHSLCDNVLLPNLEKEFVRNNFAGQKDKGTLFALDTLREHMIDAYDLYGYDCWIIKADITKYFYRINHDILKKLLSQHFHSENIIWLCNKFVDSTDGVGLPLGNQISQVFALLYLSGLDHYIEEELGVEFYGRYMDDFYLIVKSKDEARKCLMSIKAFIDELGLSLNSKTQIIPFKNGIKFCGFHTYVTKEGIPIRKLTNKKKHAVKKKYTKMARMVSDGRKTIEKFNESFNSTKNHLSYGNCKKFIYSLENRVKQELENVN